MRSLDDPWVPSSESPAEPAPVKKKRKPRQAKPKPAPRSVFPIAPTPAKPVILNVNGSTQNMISFDDHCKLMNEKQAQKEEEIEKLLKFQTELFGGVSGLLVFSLCMLIGALLGAFCNIFHSIIAIIIFAGMSAAIFQMTKFALPRTYKDYEAWRTSKL